MVEHTELGNIPVLKLNIILSTWHAMEEPYLQNNELGVLPAVKDLLHDEPVMAGNAVVCYRFILLPCWEVVWLNMLHVEDSRAIAACQLCNS